MTEARDPIETLAEIVDEFADIMEGADRTVWRYIHYRHSLLWIHAIAAILMASAFAATGREGLIGPSFRFLSAIPGSPWSLAVLLGVGGFLLAIGLIFDRFPVKRVGLAMLAVFYTLIAVSLAVPIYSWAVGDIVAKPTLYGPILYFHLSAIMIVHIGLTFRRIKR